MKWNVRDEIAVSKLIVIKINSIQRRVMIDADYFCVLSLFVVVATGMTFRYISITDQVVGLNKCCHVFFVNVHHLHSQVACIRVQIVYGDLCERFFPPVVIPSHYDSRVIFDLFENARRCKLLLKMWCDFDCKHFQLEKKRDRGNVVFKWIAKTKRESHNFIYSPLNWHSCTRFTLEIKCRISLSLSHSSSLSLFLSVSIHYNWWQCVCVVLLFSKRF